MPLMRLLSACHDRRYGGGGLSEIDAVIGCPLFTVSESQVGRDYQDLSEATKLAVTTSTYHATNWCRELLNSFVHDAAFPYFSLTNLDSQEVDANEDIRKKIILRLSTLVHLEEELRFASQYCQSFSPNGMSELKLSSDVDIFDSVIFSDSEELDGLQDSGVDEDVSMLSKEEARKLELGKKAAEKARQDKRKKDLALKNRMATKRIKDFDKIKKLRSKRALASLRPLNYEVVLALGFPHMNAIGNNGEISQDMAVGSAPATFNIGGIVAKLLLKQLLESLKDAMTEKKALQWMNANTTNGENETGQIEVFDNVYNPGYSSSASPQSKSEFRINQFLDGGVFHSIHQHLATMIEIKNSCHKDNYVGNGAEVDDEEVEGEYNMPRITLCISLILESIVVLLKSKKMSNTKSGRVLLQQVLNQLAHGEKNNSKFTMTPVGNTPTSTQQHFKGDSSEIIEGLKCLFDLCKDACCGEKVDLGFAMKGIGTLEAIIGCAERISKVGYSGSGEGGSARRQKKNEIVHEMKESMSDLCYTFMQQDWCPPLLRECRHKFFYNKDNIGVLVNCFLRCSGSKNSYKIDELSSDEVKKLNVSEIGRIGAIGQIVDEILPALADTDGCRGPVEAYPTLTQQSLSNYFSATISFIVEDLDNFCMSKFVKDGNR